MKDPLEEATQDVNRKTASAVLAAFIAGLIGLAIFRPGTRDVLAIIFGLVLMVMLHEAGHFFMARRAGMKCTEFFVGFGPKLWSVKRGETEYGVKAVLLGGYVRIIGMTNIEEVAPEDEPRTFRNGSTKNRLAVILAGVTVNILLAFLFFAIALAGRGQIPDHQTTEIRTVTQGSAADRAGLEPGDQIVSADGIRFDNWDQLVDVIQSSPEAELALVVRRDGETLRLQATPEDNGGTGFLGVGNPVTAFREIGVLDSIPESIDQMELVVTGTASTIGNLFTPDGVREYSENFTSGAPAQGDPINDRPRGIIGILDVGSQITNGDPWTLLYLLGAISLSLALFNLLPLLPFDGGHARIVLYEWAASKYKHRKVRVDFRRLAAEPAIVLGLILLLFMSTTYLDIRDVFN